MTLCTFKLEYYISQHTVNKYPFTQLRRQKVISKSMDKCCCNIYFIEKCFIHICPLHPNTSVINR